MSTTNPRPDLFTSKHCPCTQCGKTTLNTVSRCCDGCQPMGRTDWAVLRTHQITNEFGARAPFLDRPFDHIGAQRTSKDVCRDACAIQAFTHPRVPLYVWAIAAIGVVGSVVIYLTK